MAFEVARVHQLICSRVGDEGVFDPFKAATQSVESDQSFPRSCSPEGLNFHMYYPSSSVHGSRGFDHGHEVSNILTEGPSCSTETESDEEDGLFESLAQQIAQSMLDDEEMITDTCPGILKEHRFSGARDVPNVDLNEGRVSPSGWSSGSSSSGSYLSGFQNSSKGSSRISSHVSSSPSSGYHDAWDTLYAAAGEVMRLKINEKKLPAISSDGPSQAKVLNQCSRAHLPQQTRQSGQLLGRSVSHAPKRKDDMNLVASNQAQQNWAMKCAALNAMASHGRSPYPMYQHQQQAYCVDGHQGINIYRNPGKSMDSKSFQRTRQVASNGGSGVRVVFLGGPSGRESGGTGVFLPRTFTNAPEPKKRSDVSSIHSSGLPAKSKTSREGVWPTLQQSMNRSNIRQAVVHEPCLPTEWTY